MIATKPSFALLCGIGLTVSVFIVRNGFAGTMPWQGRTVGGDALAPRVPNPAIGKTLRFRGEYEWNDEGGVIHWTHKDPEGKHVDGWLEYEGIRYCSLNSSNTIRIGTPDANARSLERSINQAGIFPNTEAAFFDLRGKLIARASIGRSSGIYFFKSLERTTPCRCNIP